jgi:hypothetical protein
LTAAGATLRRLAVPRLCGTAGADDVLADVRGTLEALGYSVVAQRFTFSAWPVRHGVRTIGLLCGVALATSATLIGTDRHGAALALLLGLGGAALFFLAAAGSLISRLPWLTTAGTNLWAVRAQPARFLIVAHRDSKSQTIPLALRIAAAVVLLAVAALLSCAAARILTLQPWAMLTAGALGLAAGVVLALCGVGNDSAGALDNASGLATLLHVAEREAASHDVAFLVTDGEEFGLAGSRAALGETLALASIEAVINFDGVDDVGGFFILEGRLPQRAPGGLASSVAAAAASLGHTARRRPVPPGLMLDHVPFLRSGFPAITLMHGGLLSLARVHRPSDNPDRMAGAGIEPTVELTCAVLARLRAGVAHAAPEARVARVTPSV